MVTTPELSRVFLLLYLQSITVNIKPSTGSSLPRPPTTYPVCFVNRLRPASLSGTSETPAVLDVDRRPCVPSDRLELSNKKEALSLQTAAANAPSTGVAGAVERESTCQEPETVKNSSDIPSLSVLEHSLPSEAKSQPVPQDDICKHADVDTVPAVAAEQVTTSVADNQADVESREPRIRHASIKAVNKPLEMVKMADSIPATEARPSYRTKSLTSSSHSRLHCDMRYGVNDARNKFAAALPSAASTEQQPPTLAKRSRVRIEGSAALHGLDSREARVVSGLLTSLMQGNGSQLASAGCYKLVRKNSSSIGTVSSQASLSKPVATVSLRQYLGQLLAVVNY